MLTFCFCVEVITYLQTSHQRTAAGEAAATDAWNGWPVGVFGCAGRPPPGRRGETESIAAWRGGAMIFLMFAVAAWFVVTMIHLPASSLYLAGER